MIKDFSECAPSDKYYCGTGRKKGIRIGRENYIIKFRRNTPDGQADNHVSEYLGSHIFDILGSVAQDTWLGTYQGEEVVLIRDFTSESEVFVPFNAMRDCCLDLGSRCVEYECEDIMNVLQEGGKVTRVDEALDGFWDMFVIDAFLGNKARHGNSWGFLKNGNWCGLAPVFGNDSCLFPDIVTDHQCMEILSSREKMERWIFQFPVSKIKVDGKSCSYYEIISSHRFRECDRAIWRIIKRMDFSAIFILVQILEMLSDVKKNFLMIMLEERYKKLLLKPFERMM